MKKRKNYHYIIGCLLVSVLAGPLLADETKAAGGVLTKGEAIKMLSASDFMRQKIGALVSWTIGYDISKVSRVSLIPTINYIKVLPRRVPPDGRTIVEIIAAVDDPGGLGNIAGVRADLSEIGRLANTQLVDNGLFGDTSATDGVYTLQTSISPQISLGAKEVPVAVANKKGWLALAKTTLDIKKNPAIIEARFSPDQAKADDQSQVTLTVKVDNPGRPEDLREVVADLSAFGYQPRVPLKDNGQAGDVLAGDLVYTLQFAVPALVADGDYKIKINAFNLAGGSGTGEPVLKVYH